MGSGKRLQQLLVIAIAGIVAYFFFTPAPPPSGPGGGTEQPEGVASSGAAPGYALRAENTWPRVGSDAPAVPAAGNLFASNYYVVLDGSGSMDDVDCSAGQRKIDAARAALTSFAESVPSDANLGLAVFENQGLRERLPLGVGNREAFAQAVERVQAGAGTPLRSAIELAYGRLLAQGRRQLGYGEYHLVVVTDGMANEGEDPTDEVNRMLAESPVVLHTIGFCIGEDHVLNQPGRAYYRAADDPASLRRGLDEVLAEAPAFDVTEFRH